MSKNSSKIKVDYTKSGTSVYSYSEPSPYEEAQFEESFNDIIEHVEYYQGNVNYIEYDDLADTVKINLLIVPPNEISDFYRIITCGMSNKKMELLPDEMQGDQYIELMITLPPTWKLDNASLDNPKWNWPIKLLRSLALFPHKYETRLGSGHTISHIVETKDKYYSKNTKLSGALILPSVLSKSGFSQLIINKEKVIQFYSIYPLYQEELEYKLENGTNNLINLLKKYNITDMINPKRKNMLKKFLFFFS